MFCFVVVSVLYFAWLLLVLLFLWYACCSWCTSCVLLVLIGVSLWFVLIVVVVVCCLGLGWRSWFGLIVDFGQLHGCAAHFLLCWIWVMFGVCMFALIAGCCVYCIVVF